MEYLMELFGSLFHDILYLWLGRKLFGENFAQEPHKAPKGKRAILFLITLTIVFMMIYFVASVFFWLKR
jgi:hypothetical protein